MKADKEQRIIEHGYNLLRIFPNATERDAVKLCKKLRRLETKAHAIGLQLCNGPEMKDGEQEDRINLVLHKVSKLLGIELNDGSPNVFVNLDPRGYALKISCEWMKAFDAVLHKDMGGYGIIAPEID